MTDQQNIDEILRQWSYDPETISVRTCPGGDGREVLQMRVDLGILQLEVSGRPDGKMPGGQESYLDFLLGEAFRLGDQFVLSDEQCSEIDREFVQFYHRRVCWLRLERYERAVQDADHTLTLMDFCVSHSPDEQWTLSHEQYRPFVLFHRTQAAALAALEADGPENAVHVLNKGLDRLREFFSEVEADERFEDDELVTRLTELREGLRNRYDVGRTLQEQLDDAVAAEQFELAAKLRDELARRTPRA